MSRSSEQHLFIIWQEGRREQERILENLCETFSILSIFEVTWSEHAFADNLSRFYGGLLPPGSAKELRVGVGSFLLIVVEDANPVYEPRPRRNKMLQVNSNCYDAKMRFREWTAGPENVTDRIHGTNTTAEFRRDLTLLTGLNPVDFFKVYPKGSGVNEPIGLAQNIVGSEGWASVEQLFYILNECERYVVLRNFECLPKEYMLAKHGDIDLLVENISSASLVLNARREPLQSYRVQYKIKIGSDIVPFDLRHLGDDYYDKPWERDILLRRIFDENGYYRPSSKDYFYTLLYHAIVHKQEMAQDYLVRLQALAEDLCVEAEVDESLLFSYMENALYHVVPPKDLSVYYRYGPWPRDKCWPIVNPTPLYRGWKWLRPKLGHLKRQMKALLKW